jgi:hypothetical protein
VDRVDGVAYAPHRRIDVRDLDVDFYFFSVYKVLFVWVGGWVDASAQIACVCVCVCVCDMGAGWGGAGVRPTHGLVVWPS